MTVDPAATSVPHWTAGAAPVRELSGGAKYMIMTGPSAAPELVDAVAAQLDPRITEIVTVDAETLPRVLRDARVGWRFVLVDTGAGIARTRAELVGAGACASEITEVLHGDGELLGHQERDVFCPHCRTTTTGASAVGGLHECGSCGTSLTVYHHYSHRLGAFLGYCADAEER